MVEPQNNLSIILMTKLQCLILVKGILMCYLVYVAIAILIISAIVFFLSLTNINRAMAKKSQIETLKERHEQLEKKIEKLEELASQRKKKDQRE